MKTKTKSKTVKRTVPRPVEPITDPDQILWGARAIAAAVNLREKQAYHLLERGKLAARKTGKTWVSTQRKLRDGLLGEGAA